jgi:DNA-binding NarL/FixJ family response regulator
VIWSTSERSKDIQECQRLGATAYFKKAATAKELDHIIHQIDKILKNQLSNLKIQE